MPRRRSGRITDKSLLTAALEGLEAQKRRIGEQIERVQKMLGLHKAKPPAAGGESAPAQPAPRRRLSAVARKRIAVAQKRRWAEYRKKLGKE